MTRSRKRLLTFTSWLLATAGLIAASCFALNCLVDPLWYLSGNILTAINHPFNERLAKLNRLLPRLKDYDCVIFGTSRATLLPEDKAEGYRCFNLAFSDGQASEYLLYADYLVRRGYAPRLMIVDIRRDDLIGAVKPADVPDFEPGVKIMVVVAMVRGIAAQCADREIERIQGQIGREDRRRRIAGSDEIRDVRGLYRTDQIVSPDIDDQ